MITSTNQKGSQVSNTEVKINHDPTTTINNIVDGVCEMAEETDTLLTSLNHTDFVHDTERDEWHSKSVEMDQRWDAVEAALNSLLDARLRLLAAFNISVNIDNR